MLLALRRIFQATGFTNVDRADLVRLLNSGNFLYFGFCEEGKGATRMTPGEISERLLNDPFQNPGVVRGSQTGIFWFEGEWTIEEQEGIVTSVRERMKVDPGGGSIEIKCGVDGGVSDGPRWVAFLAASKDPASHDAGNEVVSRVPIVPPPPLIEKTQAKVSLSCRVNGEPVNLPVTPELKTLWLQATRYPKPEALKRVEELQIQIEASAGKKPDVPTNFDDLRRAQAGSRPNGKDQHSSVLNLGPDRAASS
jgi:hypothetical protein